MIIIRRAFTTLAAAFILGGTRLFACPMCFGAQESSLIDGAKLGVLALLGVLLVVQGAFAYFFFYLRKRAKENADIELDLEWSELQRGSRPS
jgi:heme/copper-type cytochrome/quinol oxidase subunit 2